MSVATRKLITVVGARPQFIKASALSRALRGHSRIEERLVHTGQHYDADMSAVFFEELDIPEPARHLGVSGGTHGEQTGRMLEQVERVLLEEKPAGVLVYGDTNSTLAGALAAAKLHVPVFHVEAGLRSFNRKMPEEVNRVLTDHVATALLCPTRTAVENLANEGIRDEVHLVGDVMYDVTLGIAESADTRSKFRTSNLGDRQFVLATMHRAENTDDPTRLRAVLAALGVIARRLPVVFPMHPRTRERMARAELELPGGVEAMAPLGFVDMAWLERHAAAIVTDSGGVQKEAYFHRTPCVTIRTESEWVETIEAGWNRLADPRDADAIVAALDLSLGTSVERRDIHDYGEGDAAARIVDVVDRIIGRP